MPRAAAHGRGRGQTRRDRRQLAGQVPGPPFEAGVEPGRQPVAEIAGEVRRYAFGGTAPVGEVEDDVGERVAGGAFEGPGFGQRAQPGAAQGGRERSVARDAAVAFGVEDAEPPVGVLFGGPPAAGAGDGGGGALVPGVAQSGRGERGVHLQRVGGEGLQPLEGGEQAALPVCRQAKSSRSAAVRWRGSAGPVRSRTRPQTWASSPRGFQLVSTSPCAERACASSANSSRWAESQARAAAPTRAAPVSGSTGGAVHVMPSSRCAGGGPPPDAASRAVPRRPSGGRTAVRPPGRGCRGRRRAG